MSPELVNQQGGVFDATVFDPLIFDTGTTWERTEPDPAGWVRTPDSSGLGYGAGGYGVGIGSAWVRAETATAAWVRSV